MKIFVTATIEIRDEDVTLICARKKAGFSQQALAKLLGTTQATISRVEQGKAAPHSELAEKWAETLADDDGR